MNDAPEQLLTATGGVAFVNETFRPNVLLSVVAGVRRRFDPDSYPKLADYLEPRNARTLFSRFARSSVDPPESTDPADDDMALIMQSMDQIATVQPSWASLFDIPIVIRKLNDDRVSVTSALIPQTIYLGKRAFSTLDTLSEVIVHEYAHIWLNLVAEIADLQTADAQESYTLPSGTGGKSLRGVLLAAHFAASAHSFHQKLGKHPQRAQYLAIYLQDCLDLVTNSRSLSPMGRAVLARLHSYAEQAMLSHLTRTN